MDCAQVLLVPGSARISLGPRDLGFRVSGFQGFKVSGFQGLK